MDSSKYQAIFMFLFNLKIVTSLIGYSKRIKIVDDRYWDGQHISEDQPILLTGGRLINQPILLNGVYQ